MKKNKEEKDKSLTTLIEELEASMKQGDSCANNELVQKIKDRNAKNKSVDNLLIKFWIFCMFLLGFSLLGNVLLVDRNEQIEQNMVNSKWKDSLFYAIMEPDSNMSVTYRVQPNGKVVTYHQLEQQKDSFSRKYEEEKNKNEITKFSHVTIEKYNDVLLENEKLKDRISFIKATYHINVIEQKNGFRLVSPEIDSALILLPYYRNMLKYNPKENSWSIKIVK